MNQSFGEDCPICYRDYSSIVLPVTTTCGHSLCKDCSTNLTRCPICRTRIPLRTRPVTNFSLLSLVDRLKTEPRKMTEDKEVQTEKVQHIRVLKPGHIGVPLDKTITAILKLSRIQQLLADTFKLNANIRP